MPNRFPLIDEEPWRSEGVRKMLSSNFIVYYWVDSENSVVWVIAVIYERRDKLSALKNIPGS